jgi:hypothetical protein
MDNQLKFFQKPNTSKSVFFLSVLVSIFWFAARIFNIYSITIIGAIFEILWLPIAIMTILLPICACIFWVKEKFILKSYYLASLTLLALTIVLMNIY